MSDFRFNKNHGGKGAGTLIGNWQEEREMRDFTGVGRSVIRGHIPKKHLDFENPINTNMKFDDTVKRIYGEEDQQVFFTNNTSYGTAKSSTEGISKIGRKEAAREAQIRQQVNEEMQQRAAEEHKKTQFRYFDTTSGMTHCSQDLTANVVGKKVMKTQDGHAIGMHQRDQQLIVEQGLWRRTQNFTDEELRAKVPAGDYTQSNPVTIYTEALERKNHYMSASTGPNPFARTSGVTQPMNMTKSKAEGF